MPRPTTLEICRKYLYEDVDKIPETFRDRIVRTRFAFTYMYQFPTKPRIKVRDEIVSQFNVAQKTAYEDIQVVEILLGDIKNPSKDWMRYKVNAMLEEAYDLAKFLKDAKAMALVADKLGKYNMLDKPEAETLPYADIVPQQFEPTDDPTPLGLVKDPNIREKKKKMLEKYMDEIEIVDVPYEEIIRDGNEGEEENIL